MPFNLRRIRISAFKWILVNRYELDNIRCGVWAVNTGGGLYLPVDVAVPVCVCFVFPINFFWEVEFFTQWKFKEIFSSEFVLYFLNRR